MSESKNYNLNELEHISEINEDYTKRQGRYSSERTENISGRDRFNESRIDFESRSTPGRYESHIRGSDRRLSNSVYGDYRFDDTYYSNNRYSEKHRGYDSDRQRRDHFFDDDMFNRDNPRNLLNYNRDYDRYIDPYSHGNHYDDYAPPGVDMYDCDDYDSHDRHSRRGGHRHDYTHDRSQPNYSPDLARDRSPLRHDDRYQYDDRIDDYDRGGEKWMTDVPTNTVILRGLPIDVDEKDILNELNVWQVVPKDVRLMRKKASGVSRGFAFVEFRTIEEARGWMDATQGRVTIKFQLVNLYYSSPKSNIDRSSDIDWTCAKCCAHNFKRREQCYICGISRGESDRSKEGDGFDHIGSNPCNTLLFRGLDALTTDVTLKKAIRNCCKRKPKNIKVMYDALTGTSLGYAFAEFSTVKEATPILEQIQNIDPPFEVDGKQLLVAYAKNTFNTIMATIENYQVQWNQQQQGGWDYGQSQPQSYYNYNMYYGQQAPTSNAPAGSNQATAVAQAAIAQAHAAKTLHSAASTATQPTPPLPTGDGSIMYAPPDVSTYQYDETSGYYFDPKTGLYYDSNSQYFYNNQTGQFLYWSSDRSTYLLASAVSSNVTNTTTQSVSSDPSTNSSDKLKDKDKKEKAKVAKKIAKDMEKWAKSQNASKAVTMRHVESAPVAKGETTSRSADAGFFLLEKSKGDMHLMPPPAFPQSSSGTADSDSAGLVASYGGDSDSDDDDSGPVNEESYLDWTKLICNLCKRQFNSKDTLLKHKEMSDLHKQNLAKLISSKQGSQSMKAKKEEKYRDRAAERRNKYGAPKPPEVEREFVFPPPVDIGQNPTSSQSAFANKMMQKMGWSEGQGLGREAQGIVNPIESKMRNASAGLGARGASYNVPAGTRYKEAGKQAMYARFQELD